MYLIRVIRARLSILACCNIAVIDLVPRHNPQNIVLRLVSFSFIRHCFSFVTSHILMKNCPQTSSTGQSIMFTAQPNKRVHGFNEHFSQEKLQPQ